MAPKATGKFSLGTLQYVVMLSFPYISLNLQAILLFLIKTFIQELQRLSWDYLLQEATVRSFQDCLYSYFEDSTT
jgi:hypothetical protein